jgi:PAS domain S-box-containing protein
MAGKPTYEELEQRVKDLEEETVKRKCAEEAVLESEKKFFTVLENAKEGIMIIQDNRIVYVNPRVEQLSPFSREEIFSEAFPYFIHPEDRITMIQRYLQVKKGKKFFEYHDYRILDKERNTRWVTVNSTSLIFRGKPAILIFLTEITQLKRIEEALRESEARYREIFEHTINGVAVYRAVNDSEDFMLVDFNKSGERIEKIKRDEVIGKSVLEVFPGIKEFGLFEVMQRVWATGEAERLPVSLYKDERIVGWRESFVYKLPSGEIVVVYSDETERKNAEDSLRKAHEEISKCSQEFERKVQERTNELKEKNKQLIQAERLAAFGKMANRVAHELRNPLTVVGGFARRICEKTSDNDPNKKYLKVIVGEVMALENKVSEITKTEKHQ